MASLSPNISLLGLKNARHLLRRASFSYTNALLNQLAVLTPSQAVDLLCIESPLSLSLPYDPLPENAPDGFWTNSSNLATSFSDQERKASIVSAWWWYNAYKSPTMQYKLCHFLSTRFTVEKANGAGSATEFFDYIQLLLHYSYGNYKTLAQKITCCNSMLNYLNNTSNSKAAPNENYAREFLELFTIGKGNQIAAGNYTTYTEADIVQAAKVLTGFKRQSDRSILDPDTGIPCGKKWFSDHDTSSKTFSSAFDSTTLTAATSENEMEDELHAFVEMIFSKTATAKNICRKLYTYFVSSTITNEIENDIITPLAQDLINANYEMVPVLKKLLISLHFYDADDTTNSDEIIGGLLKSPIQQLSEICSFLEAQVPDPNTYPLAFYNTFWESFAHNTFLKKANMLLFDPENVAGHPAYYQQPDFDKNWISGSSLIARYRLGESLVDGKNRIEGNTDINAKINLTEVLRFSNVVTVVDDPYILTSELCKALFGQEPDAERINYFMNTFLLQGQPPIDWTALWGYYLAVNFNSVVDLRLNALLTNLLKAPEAQLF
jgi:uncharacterized protein (DUF1800 family)